MSLLCMLYYQAAHHHLNIVITHITSTNNHIAEALSRFQTQRFQVLAPTAHLMPDHIPAWPTPSFIQPFNNLFILG